MLKTKLKLFVLIPVLATGACAYGIDGAHQDVKFETPGAHGAYCDVYIEKLRYRVKPPQVINVFKSQDGMTVDCKAPGNRRIIEKVESKVEKSTAWNASNVGVGVPWDYASGAMFRYPDVIKVDFTRIPVSDPPLPAQNNPDIRQPEEYDLEQFSPGSPRLNSDKTAPPVEIQRRQSGRTNMQGDDGTGAFSEPAVMSGGKGNVQAVMPADALNPSSGGTSEPIPLIPGE